jgi:membrane-associated protease RseP (regulator of RpoE activity)
LLLLTIGSVFFVGLKTFGAADGHASAGLAAALQYTATLMSILIAHESGHFIAARIHRVDASLPYFLPMPIPPFGTMGAVIRMRGVIPTRKALLDIGAAGPLAGLVLAIPLYVWGIHQSQVVSLASLDGGGEQLGSSILLRILDHFFAPPVPEGSDVLLSPVAFGAWAGMLVTMLNLIPASQLDGGHVAYALFGPRQNEIARWVHRSMVVFFFVSVTASLARDWPSGLWLMHLGRHVNESVFWLFWFELLAVLGSLASPPRRRPADTPQLTLPVRIFGGLGIAVLAGLLRDCTRPGPWLAWLGGVIVLLTMEARYGALRPDSRLLDHPATSDQPLTFARVAVAVLTLAFFALLFMPAPFSM